MKTKPKNHFDFWFSEWDALPRRLPALLIFLAIVLSSCGPKPAVSSPTFTPLQLTNTKPAATNTAPAPTSTEPAATVSPPALLEAGQTYSDASDDMAISFLDVVAFQATVNEESETLEAVFHMRDIPSTATQRQIKNFVEYWWEISVFLDPSKVDLATPGDYNLSLITTIDDPSSAPVGEGIWTPVPGEPVIVPINQLWDSKEIYNSSGEIVSTLDAVADPDLDTLTLIGRVPGIRSSAVLSFSTFYYDGTIDRPDNYVPPPPIEGAPSETVLSTQVKNDELQLIPAGVLRAYPGPDHYAGDVLTFEILLDRDFSESSDSVTLTLDDAVTTEVASQLLTLDRLLLPMAFDTTNLIGSHQLKFSTPNGSVNHAYSFEVLPASQRPANEKNAAWMVEEIDCCIFHYISGTAAARDIEFIVEHFQTAAEEISAINGRKIDPKLVIYLIDRMWYNGAFASVGELVVSYTDRYYGPTNGAEGLKVMARHEFTHVVGFGDEQAGDGIFFSSEGLAVYVAGGHYKPEPLAERGAALYDLGYYVPVGQSIKQHELAYLHSAAVLTYIAEAYGSETVPKLLAADEDPQDGQTTPLETAIQSTLGISLSEFDKDFQAWLESKDPGEQLDDLRLTIELQDLRREYQDTYAPPPELIVGIPIADAVARPEYLPVMIREANAPANVAIELIIAEGQQAIVDADYFRAEELINILSEIVSTGQFENPLAKDYLDIVLALADAGYEAVSLDLQGNQATAEVTIVPPAVISVELENVNSIWQVKP